MTANESDRHAPKPMTFPRSGQQGPNLATLERLRRLRRPRLMAPEARRHAVARECAAC